jgi:hypothetical protein
MASPHAVGVAALIINQRGTWDFAHPGGLTMSPAMVENILRSSATSTPCPTPPTVDYTIIGRDPSYTATCVGAANLNSFYGDGIVNALKAVRGGTSEGDNP